MDSKYTMEERGDNYTLTVTNVRQPDLGDYTCTAVNKISEQQAIVILTGNQKNTNFSLLKADKTAVMTAVLSALRREKLVFF